MMMNKTGVLICFIYLSVVCVFGCQPDTSAHADADADSDTDGDSDSDGDADSETEPDSDDGGESDTDEEEDTCPDDDGDGVCAEDDCDDSAATGGSCSTGCLSYYEDNDEDGYGLPKASGQACVVPDGYVGRSGDCADDDENRYPGAADYCGDDFDANCDDVDSVCPSQGDVIITEILKDPIALYDNQGEWFELYNTTETDFELGGLTIRDADSDSFVIESSVIVPAMDYVVFARSDEAIDSPDYVYADFELANGDDEIILQLPTGDVIAEVYYDDGDTFPDPAGASLGLDPMASDFSAARYGAFWCAATSTFSTGDRGTPGLENDSCEGDGLFFLSRTEGLHVGGLELQVRGRGFEDATDVVFGGVSAESFSIENSTTIIATTPAHDTGWVDVVVRRATGDLSLSNVFLFTGTDSDLVWCNTQWPRGLTVAAGTPTEEIFGQVLLWDVTNLTGQGPGIRGQLGYGTPGTNPADDHSWIWTDATYNVDVGDNDEYEAILTITDSGEYAYAYRFAREESFEYLYCDSDGSEPAHDPHYNPGAPGPEVGDELILNVTPP